MRNILHDTAEAFGRLHGRPRYICEWIPPDHINEKAILNVGCGFGWFERFVAEHRSPTRIVGIEPTQKDLQSAVTGLAGLPVELVLGSALALPFADESFDTCLCSEVLEHIPRASESILFSEIFRVLRAGGNAFVTTPAATPIAICSDPAFWLTGHRHYSIPQIERFASSAGFSIESIEIRGRWMDLISLWDLYISKWIFRRQPCLVKMTASTLDEEYLVPKGFMGIFCVLKKPESKKSV